MPEFNALISNLNSKDEKILKETLEQLGELGDSRAVPHLLKLLEEVSEEDIIESILWTLSLVATSETLISLLTHSNEMIVVEILDALGRQQRKETVDEIISFLKHDNDEIRAMATWALGKIPEEKTYRLLIDILKTDKDPAVRAHAAWGIGKFEKQESISILTDIKAQETDESVLYNLEEAIDRLESAKDSSQKGIKATIYECPKREIECANKSTRTETKSDELIKIEIILCDSCLLAKICQVNLVKNLNL